MKMSPPAPFSEVMRNCKVCATCRSNIHLPLLRTGRPSAMVIFLSIMRHALRTCSLCSFQLSPAHDRISLLPTPDDESLFVPAQRIPVIASYGLRALIRNVCQRLGVPY